MIVEIDAHKAFWSIHMRMLQLMVSTIVTVAMRCRNRRVYCNFAITGGKGLLRNRLVILGRRAWWRWMLLAGLMLLLLAGGTLVVMLSAGTKAVPQAADVIVILGARVYPDRLSASLRARLDTGLSCYGAGLAEHLIVSGGQGIDEPTTEAAAMRDYLIARGVEPADIYLDEQAYSTWDNLRNSQAIMEEQGWERALLVTSDYHVLRTNLLARRLKLDSTLAAAPLPVPAALRWRMLFREVLALWKDFLLLPWKR